MKTLIIRKGYTIDTPTGYQQVVAQHGPTSFIVHNYDENGQYKFASILTDREILHHHHDATRQIYDLVEYEN